MACTALLISAKDGSDIKHKIKVTTTPLKEGIQVDWFSCDDHWVPTGLLHNNLKDQTELDFHMELRRNARIAGTYVIGESTNPEINVYLDAEKEQPLGE